MGTGYKICEVPTVNSTKLGFNKFWWEQEEMVFLKLECNIFFKRLAIRDKYTQKNIRPS